MSIITSEEISKDVERVERWQRRITVAWMMVKKQLLCIMFVHGPQTGRAESEKRAFREELERMVGLVEAHVMTCIAEYFNGHVGTAETGEEDSVGGFGFGTRNQDGRELIELFMRNGLAVAGTFFKKRKNHKISYRSGQHKTELDLLVARREQMWRVRECKIIVGEQVATQHRPLFYVVRMQKRREDKVVGRKTIK